MTRSSRTKSKNTDTTNDEALARALQEQYRAEEQLERVRSRSNVMENSSSQRPLQRSQSQRSQREPPVRSSPPSPPPRQGSPRRREGSPQQRSSSGRKSDRKSSRGSKPKRPKARVTNPPPASELSAHLYSKLKPGSSAATAATEETTAQTTVNIADLNDTEYSAHLQKLEDEEYARRLQQMEERAAAPPAPPPPQTVAELRAEAVVQQQQQRQAQNSRCRKYLPYATFLCTVAIGLTVFFVVFDGNVDNLPNLPSLEDLWPDSDPFDGENGDPNSANKWSSRDPGLDLTILNSLSKDWTEAFYQAVSDWDNPPPPEVDVLRLTTSTTPYESECSPVRDKMKVCNGRYGDTNWRGINEVLIRRGYILSSVAKMNDSYLSDSSIYQRQYTMCHEIGHGFGLPHTDEDFYNKDLGNCMDYTSNPKNNLRPSTMNFEFLANMYGVDINPELSVDGGLDDGTRHRNRYNQEETGEDENRRRKVRIWNYGDSTTDSDVSPEEEDIPEWNEYKSLVRTSSTSHLDDFLEQVLHKDSVPPYARRTRKWRTLHKREEGQAHELDLGNGYTYRVSVLH
uniref:Peptidase M10 metallopeptidase domain-containing protein n=1 Tax=Ditylum brightwellii TaxID=49249 RepID=A0A7S4QYC8_9STRA|mmetsp:Transcript_22516/g.33765  ORF Transcript_22516/g.33765 Transcript_22516/m.33765 type:complete len:569 (-) Transcript_22516:77-1783(-)